MAHVAALKGSRYRVLDEDGYDALAPAVGGVLPALVDDLSEKSRRDLGAGVTRNLQVVAEAATGAVQRWIKEKKERKQTTQGRDGRTARRHHTGILRRGVWCAIRRPP